MSDHPPQPAAPHRSGLTALLPDISFRVRILVALVASVGLLGLASLAVIRYQTQRQVDQIVQHTAEREQRALGELERFRRADLERIASRVTGSIRIAAALDAAGEGSDANEFVEQVQYELTLAEFKEGLAAFADKNGRPILTLVDGQRVADGQTKDDLFKQVTANDAGLATGYEVFQERLFAVEGHRLKLFGDTVGALTLGFRVDDDVAGRLGTIVDSDVCFVARGTCVAGTPALRRPDLAGLVLEAAGAQAPIFTTIDNRRVALVASALPASDRVVGVIAVPLEVVLAPFDRIRLVERVAAASALLLAIALGLVLSNKLTRPIRTLVAATERVARGDYDFSVQVPHRDELGTLASSFNQMTEGLLLKERYRGVLDKVVSPHIAEELMKGELRLGGETRVVTTLFADVRGFTGLTEHLAPEQVIAMLNEWLELAAEPIEEEGGVVDKYVGDQVMAIFGAPIAHADHAARAVRAGLRLRDVTEDLNRTRLARGDQPLTIGIGINTGPAVAGNTGSSKRLNYTVLGASVNTAARLCSEAGAGELLIAEDTYVHVADRVEITEQPPRVFKGFSKATTCYAVHAWRALMIVACVSLLAPRASSGQVIDLPTLSDLGVKYVSPGGLVEIRPSLRIDFDAYIPQDEPARQIDETSPFAAGRGSLFLDLFVGRRVYASTELRMDRGQPPHAGSLEGRVQQAFVRVTPMPGRNLSFQVGKSISPFGNYPGRAHTTADPFIRPPLPYDYPTIISPDVVPGSSDVFLTWKDKPQFRAEGLPVVWATPYAMSATAAGGGRRWGFVVGVTSTAPSAEPEDWNRLKFDAPAGASLVGHATFQIVPELRVGGSYSRGAYMRPDVHDASGPLAIPRQTQELRAAEATFTRGHLEARGEVLFNRWEVFRAASDPKDVSYYVEARVALVPGLFAAARVSGIHFRDLEQPTGGASRWDYDVRRVQLGSGYRLGRGTEIRAEYMINRTLGRDDPRDNLVSLQWWWMF